MSNTWQHDFERRTSASLRWLEKSIEATGHKGSAAYFHLWKGWSAAYPETTGYIIETLFDYAAFLNKSHYADLSSECAMWLCNIQNADGSFPGGVGTNNAPLVFDSGQILFGLTRTYRETGNQKFLESLEKAVLWLMQILEPDGSWQQYAYMPGYVPAYYTRVVWAVLYANTLLQKPEIESSMESALNFYVAKITSQYSIRDWGFRAKEHAFTHTIAYTARGILESGYLLNMPHFITIAEQIAQKLLQVYKIKNRYAGTYDTNWKGDYTFECVTGNAQLSLFFARLYQIKKENIYRSHANEVFNNTFAKQSLVNLPGLYGGIPGSAPWWGSYQRFKFPNWAAKFYLDAYLLNYQISG